MPTQFIRGIHLSYDDKGPIDAPPIVFIHGHPFNRSMWDEQVAHFSNSYRLILPDLRGYGETGLPYETDASSATRLTSTTNPADGSRSTSAAAAPPTKTLLDEMALDIAHLLETLNIRHAIFCGLSMGGQIALDFYRLFPQKVRALLIVDSDARGETPGSRVNRLNIAEEILAKGMVRHTDETIHKYIAPASMHNKKVYDPLYRMMSSTSPAGAAAAHRGRADRRDHTAILKDITVPSLVIVGAEDFFTPLPIAKIMSDNIPGCRLACIEGAGHLPNMETPGTFNKIVEEFLNQLDK